ncbi:hypothetical protein [Planktothricoides raciborskii]|uniref:Uncharacterized protein n=1 Tax=Planktothricoides raciborskii FACHB-1370 TaxID=2949576 RepID=A0ABR8EKA6_9CYAN|nr:hypothetical protein [Planktothricoides raciborskii]MBD2547339.1 hypothetical protein [Planktothricoides raciborskii FACHB-1370]MBD2585839.1 hypothetical protein [Planktothricoides raciborskii FACHB-1261]
MADIRNLIKQIAAESAQLCETQFVAPSVRGGKVRTRVAGLIYTFTPKSKKFEGWGIFQPINEKTARLVAEADLPEITEYLAQFPLVRLWLVDRIQGKSWLAYPVNESDLRQRMGLIQSVVQPVVVHLVSEAGSFDPIMARFDGASWWFEAIDRRADPIATQELCLQFQQMTPPEKLRFKGMTPEMRIAYELRANQSGNFHQKNDEGRLQQALKMGGGELQKFEDRGDDYWLVEWTTTTGECHTSAIAKEDLTVISAGICLSGGDRLFDLQSLVGVVEQRD